MFTPWLVAFHLCQQREELKELLLHPAEDDNELLLPPNMPPLFYSSFSDSPKENPYKISKLKGSNLQSIISMGSPGQVKVEHIMEREISERSTKYSSKHFGNRPHTEAKKIPITTME